MIEYIGVEVDVCVVAYAYRLTQPAQISNQDQHLTAPAAITAAATKTAIAATKHTTHV